MPEGLSWTARTDPAGLVAPDGVLRFRLGDFTGRWRVSRIVVDHLTGAVSRFEGVAELSATDFAETGEVRVGGLALKAHRRYGLQDGVDGVDVAFAAGRPFIRLNGDGWQTVRHLCGDDDYRGVFAFRSVDAWVERWRVAGPRKRYASLARYSRQSA